MIRVNIDKQKNIKNPFIITGFQGMWLVGPIVVQYLRSHMNFEKIGDVTVDSAVPAAMIDKGELIKPITLYYNKETNVVLVQSIIPSSGIEWDLSEMVKKLREKFDPQQIIAVDGVETEEKVDVYYYSNCGNKELIEKSGAKQIKKATIFGFSSVLLIEELCPVFCLFGRIYHLDVDSPRPVHSNSMTAARIVGFLNEYLHMDVETKTLEEESSKIEQKIKELSQKMPEQLKDANKPAYFG